MQVCFAETLQKHVQLCYHSCLSRRDLLPLHSLQQDSKHGCTAHVSVISSVLFHRNIMAGLETYLLGEIDFQDAVKKFIGEFHKKAMKK